MAKYRRKALEVEAVQITRENYQTLGVYINSLGFWFSCNANLPVEIGDYIVIDNEGSKYPCNQSVFEATYEPISFCKHGIEFDKRCFDCDPNTGVEDRK